MKKKPFRVTLKRLFQSRRFHNEEALASPILANQ